MWSNSPYVNLIEFKGKVLFIRVNLSYNTTFHALEELAQVPFTYNLNW